MAEEAKKDTSLGDTKPAMPVPPGNEQVKAGANFDKERREHIVKGIEGSKDR